MVENPTTTHDMFNGTMKRKKIMTSRKGMSAFRKIHQCNRMVRRESQEGMSDALEQTFYPSTSDSDMVD